jgi:hypothetical protein
MAVPYVATNLEEIVHHRESQMLHFKIRRLFSVGVLDLASSGYTSLSFLLHSNTIGNTSGINHS